MGAATSTSNEGRAHFTYIWAIENGYSLTFGTILSSPVFIVNSLEMTKWSLGWYVFGSDIRLFLQREQENAGPEWIEIDYDLSFLGADGLPLIKNTGTFPFRKGFYSGFSKFAEKDEVFCLRRAEFLPRDVLTVRCRMWRKTNKTLKPHVCFARTRFGLDRHCFVWAIKDFSSLPLGYKTTRLLKSTSVGASALILNFCLKEYGGKVCVSIDIERKDVTKIPGITGEIALLDGEGAVVHSETICLNYFKRNMDLCRFVEKPKLLSSVNNLLPNDVLSLRCEFEIYYGPLWSGIEN
ncbi:hypothetical protein AVEN_162693-1 [Araneus ventricosus]|uniref:MATH domain-containing protein n=1 Tax=Araneus ventricosus TaxID=182803 RepID=A0A4Y2RVI7_ARAVE|nr:hypothetical protein AVEN_162693-1 [Araneus ventricosus]